MKNQINNNHYFIDLFEKRLSEFTGAPFVVLTDSGTSAMFLVLRYLKKYKNMNKLDITIPNKTYLSVPQGIIHAGFNVHFEDIDWESNYNLKGTPIWDYTVGFKENQYIKNQYQFLSFHQKKAIPIGKGGAILLDNEEDYQILKRMSWDGRDSSIPVHQDTGIILGYHCYMPPDDAAKGVLLLNQYVFNEKHIKNSNHYPNISKLNYV